MAGNAWTLGDDLKQARAGVPEAPVIAVNGAAAEVEAIALYSKHPSRFIDLGWIRRQCRFGSGFRVHGSNLSKHGELDHVDFWWEDARGGGGSAWGARKLAWLMGFDPVILCGCPLVLGPYVGNHNIRGLMHKQEVVDQFHREIELEPEWHDGVTSCSGWTREVFGEPG